MSFREFLAALGIILFAGMFLSTCVVFGPGQWIGTHRVGDICFTTPSRLASVDGWNSIKDDGEVKVTKVLGVYYVGTKDTRPYPHDGRRAWEARPWMIEDGLKVILDAQIEAQESAE